MKKTFFQKLVKKNTSKIRRLSRGARGARGKSFLKTMMGNYYQKIHKEKIENIKKFLLPDLKNEEIREISKNFKERFYENNEIIGKQGEKIKNLFLLTKGEILISKKYIRNFPHKNYDENVKKINKYNSKKIIIKKKLCILSPGALIGLNEVLDGDKIYKYTYCAKKDNTNFFKISLNDFFDIIKKKKRKFFFEQKNLLYKKLMNYTEKKIENLIELQTKNKKTVTKNFNSFNYKNEKEKDNENLEDKNNFRTIKKYQRFRMRSQNSNLLIKNLKKTKNMTVGKKKYIKDNITFLTNIKKIKNQVKKNKNRFFENKKMIIFNKKKKTEKQNISDKLIDDNQKIFTFINGFRNNVIDNNLKKKIDLKKKNLKLKKLRKLKKFQSQGKKFFNPQKKIFSTFIKKTSNYIFSTHQEPLFIKKF